VKEFCKYFNNWQSYNKNKSGVRFFWTTLYMTCRDRWFVCLRHDCEHRVTLDGQTACGCAVCTCHQHGNWCDLMDVATLTAVNLVDMRWDVISDVTTTMTTAAAADVRYDLLAPCQRSHEQTVHCLYTRDMLYIFIFFFLYLTVNKVDYILSKSNSLRDSDRLINTCICDLSQKGDVCHRRLSPGYTWSRRDESLHAL